MLDLNSARAATCGWTDDDWRAVLSTWQCYARPEQLRPEGAPRWYNRQTGRGNGKTRGVDEYILDRCEDYPFLRVGIASQTHGSTRKELIEGDAGLMRCCSLRGYDLEYIPSKTVIKHPSGAQIFTYSGDDPKPFRGPQHHLFWADELGYWMDPMETFKVIDDGLRLPWPGVGAHGIITCTPSRRGGVSHMLRDNPNVLTTYGTTFDNARYLDPEYVRTRIAASGGEGTTRYKEEILGLLLDGGASFSQAIIDRNRESSALNRDLREIVIGIDPATTSKLTSDECGIIPVGVGGHHDLMHFYPLEDLSVQGQRATEWIPMVLRRASYLRSQFHCAVRFVIEVNQGGDAWQIMFEQTAANINMPYPDVTEVNAIKSKTERADAAAMLYEQNRVHHIGVLAEVEKQQTTWLPGMPSPDRMDALVHALNELGAKYPAPIGDGTGRFTGA